MRCVLLDELIERIEKNKIAIIRKWINTPTVIPIIKTNLIDENLFVRRYSFGVIEYYIQVIKKDENIEKSHAMIDFIRYLKKQNVRVNELFLMFCAFKEAFISFSSEEKIHSLELEHKINFIFEKFFSNVLDVYSKTITQIENALNKSIDIVDKYVIISRTDVNGIITSVSTAFCKISGYEPFELIGKSHTIMRHPDMSINFFEKLWKTIKSGNIWEGEVKNLRKDGTTYWVKTTIVPNFDNSGNITSFDALRVNITPQIELKNQQNLLVEQSKSAALGEMISMIAHQWRQPLQAVSILIQKLPLLKMLKGELTDETLEEVVSQVTIQLDYMSKTIDDFRDYFKPNKKKEEVYIENVINKSMDFLSYLFKLNSVEIKYKNESTTRIYIFLNEMVQVFINLAKNSCDAMIEKNIEDRFISIYSYEKDGDLFIEFEDNAGGMKPEVMGKIFDPYFSTKSKKNGTGLGLYMSKTIIEQHSSGRISVSNTDNGAKFTIKLPLN